jgi:hypothetical protein
MRDQDVLDSGQLSHLGRLRIHVIDHHRFTGVSEGHLMIWAEMAT